MTATILNIDAERFQKPTEPPSIAGLIYAGRRHVISGPPESLKTLVTLAISLDHIRAGGVAGFMDFENGPHSVRRMLDDLGATQDERRRFAYVELDSPPDQADLDSFLAEKITLMIIDATAGAYALTGLDDNSRLDAELFGTVWINPLWTAGLTTIVIDHVSKASVGSGSKFTIGSERKVGMTDVHLGLEAVVQLSRGKTGVVRIRTHKDRPGHLARPVACEIELDSDPFTNLLTWGFRPPSGGTGDDWKPTFLMEKVMEHFDRFPDAQMPESIANAVLGKREYVLKAIDALVGNGSLSKSPDGKVSPQGVLIERDGQWDDQI